ncbi:translation initiation factor 2 [Actinoplanes sp. NEAU-A12]|uniref:Translation initiation factor 2 n=1 Tax=Actinoplanes sandaracinus TaxID=3045177 RepID=A0ABT6WDW3_9ACTN|nr:translation initiation factor 2 [Actinoplanes sandaracinus]MDI6097914.1 translation initiation factor 2 [Actinoplanes sandaracinus]
MFHQHFLSPAGTDLGPLDGGERVLWSGRCAVAEYAFDEASSLPRWTLPEQTDVVVTDRRVRYIHTTGETQSSGELFWLWPQHLRVQPGNRETGRNATVTQIQLVCTGPDGTFPALVFAGGALATIGDADRLANTLRQAIARFRVENADLIGVPAPQARMLSRLVIGPEFSNYQGGQGQTVTLLGAVPVPGPEAAEHYQEPAYAAEPTYAEPAYPEPAYQEPVYQGTAYQDPYQEDPVFEETPVSSGRAYAERPGREADALRAEEALRAELKARQAEPDLASRAASLAARVANLVSHSPDDGQATNLSAYLDQDR